jgi:hypothetical protein
MVITVGMSFGQNVTGSIGGIVQDPSKALIPGVTITMTNVATGVVATQVSNESGAYSFQSVQPGTYKMTAALPSFKTSVVNELVIGTTAQVRWNFALQVGDVTSQIEVVVGPYVLVVRIGNLEGEVTAAS